MKSSVDSRFEDLAKAVNVAESIYAFSEITGEKINFQAYLNKPSTGGGVWFSLTLRNLVLLLEINHHLKKRAGPRLKDLALYVQNKCYDSVSALLADVDKELELLCAAMKKENNDSEAIPPAIIIEKSLFMGRRLLFALLNHSKHVPLILGSTRFGVEKQ